jgi:hypothetical protein
VVATGTQHLRVIAVDDNDTITVNNLPPTVAIAVTAVRGNDVLIDRTTFNRVQALLGDRVHQTNELLSAGGQIRCGHSGGHVTGEKVVQKNDQVLALFKQIKQRDTVRDSFTNGILEWARLQQSSSRTEMSRAPRELTLLRE